MLEQRVRDRSDTYGARHAVKAVGGQIGFSRRACDELAIVVSELCSNILKYGVHGSIRLEELTDERGIMIVARDFGPQFHDLSLAMQDGFNDRGPIDPMHMMKRGGIGGGLGAVVRFSHSFRVDSLPNGKAIEVVRYLDRALPGSLFRS
jgi:anti-sigma regulatory factor (Ser/Thr protein kinase)